MNNINTKKILDFIKKNNLSKSAFCKNCKINLGIYYKIMNGQANFRINALFKIAKYMQLNHVVELFRD
ncbi:MAG: helix-turn-helix transcriptional regulator [Clostridia bacterium]|nr:helix-turn-helix transcriptional regulator [Clostridia bacterium]